VWNEAKDSFVGDYEADLLVVKVCTKDAAHVPGRCSIMISISHRPRLAFE
jgi:hypothetical protein